MAIGLWMAAAIMTVPIAAQGPKGELAGSLIDVGTGAPVVLIIPGSGPTDRDGNNPLGITAASYRLLAEALGERGVSTVRIDKRGMFGSKAAINDANAVTIADYASDTHSWVDSIRKRTGQSCVWVLGHSEGALVALAAAQKPDGLCGVILVAAPGRKFGDLLREQLRANPANAPVLAIALGAIDSLEQGKPVDLTDMPKPLQALFAPQVQPFMIDLMAKDPAALAASARLPMLIVHGGRDIQVPEQDARLLAAAQPEARLVVIPQMNHVLKDVRSDDRAANLVTYADPSLPVDSRLVDAIAEFVGR